MKYFIAIKLKLLSDHLVGGEKKGKATCQLSCSVIANGIDAGLCLDFNSLTLFRTTEADRQASLTIPHP